MQIKQIIRTHVNTNLISIQCQLVEPHIAERAVAEISWLSAIVACPYKQVVRVGHSPIVHCRRPTTVGLAVMIYADFVVGAVHDEGKVHPLPCRHGDTRVDRKSMTRSLGGRVEAQRLPHTPRAKELITRAFASSTLHRHIALAHITRIIGISFVAHPSRKGKTLVGSDVEVFVMRNAHVLVGAVECDVMGRLCKCSSQSHQQDSKSKEFLHGNRCYRIKRQCIGGKNKYYSTITQLFHHINSPNYHDRDSYN